MRCLFLRVGCVAVLQKIVFILMATKFLVLIVETNVGVAYVCMYVKIMTVSVLNT